MTTPEEKIKKLDFTKVTRDADKTRTRILIKPRYGMQSLEIVCGRTNLNRNRDRTPSYERLTARASYGVIDFEHDSAYIFQIPLVGVALDFVENSTVYYSGILLGRDPEDLRISLDTDYDPTKLKGAYKCNGKECRSGKSHMIVPEGYWAGPEMKVQTLYLQLVGAEVSVILSTPSKEDPDHG